MHGRLDSAGAAEATSGLKRRVMLVIVLVAAGYMGVIVKLVYLQVIEKNFLAQKALRQQQEVVDLPPRRGTIYDRTGAELAVSVEADSLYGVPANVHDPHAVAAALAPVLGKDVKSLERKLEGDRKFVWLARQVSPDVQPRIKTDGDMEGVLGWLFDSRRYYPQKDIAAHVLGFTGTDGKGLDGLEGEYDRYIGGLPGKAITEKDGRGRQVLTVDEDKNSPRPGCDIILTINEKVQYMADKALDEIMKKYRPISASAIVMDPNTGEVLAMANRPGFNPNNWARYPASSWRNRAVTDLYEPGSTFKIVTASAALEEGVVRPSDIIDCGHGELDVDGTIIHSADNEGGRLSFQEVIQKSNNVGTIKVALKLGAGRLYKYARAFGIGKKTGIDLPGEAGGELRDLSKWSGLSVASVAIGQEVGVTPLQMLCAMNCIANGGYYMKPYVVSEIRGADGSVIMKRNPVKVRQVISTATAVKLRNILTTVVEDGGTAVEANIKGYQVAGKTGTAQKFEKALGRYSKTKYYSSFVGFCPADNPKISAIVVLNEPHGGAYYGGVVAAPAFKNIVEQALTYMKVPTRLPEQTIMVGN
ncbi:MAG: peptidoglycan D,D-transpeptidase FtsI family protein [Nitrospirota bacterium]